MTCSFELPDLYPFLARSPVCFVVLFFQSTVELMPVNSTTCFLASHTLALNQTIQFYFQTSDPYEQRAHHLLAPCRNTAGSFWIEIFGRSCNKTDFMYFFLCHSQKTCFFQSMVLGTTGFVTVCSDSLLQGCW
jgi:hypothetical protein